MGPTLRLYLWEKVIFSAYLVNRVIANFQKNSMDEKYMHPSRDMYHCHTYIDIGLLLWQRGLIANVKLHFYEICIPLVNKPIRSYQIHSLKTTLFWVWLCPIYMDDHENIIQIQRKTYRYQIIFFFFLTKSVQNLSVRVMQTKKLIGTASSGEWFQYSGFPASGKVRENFFSGKSGNLVEGQGKSGNFALTEVN